MIKTFISVIKKIRQIINILIGLPFLALFYIYVNLGYHYYNKDKNDKIRVKYSNKIFYFLFKGIYYSLGNQIRLLNNSQIELSTKINIINCNHEHQNDIFILYYICYLNSFLGCYTRSISTSVGINNFDRKFLSMADHALVNQSNKDVEILEKMFKKWNKNDYYTILGTFFEGIAKKDSKSKSKTLKHLLDPKTLGFALTAKYSKSKYMYDVNLIYTHQGKLMDSRDPSFTWLLFHPDTKIYVDLHKYELPSYEKAVKWIKDLYYIKDQQIDNIIKKHVTSNT